MAEPNTIYKMTILAMLNTVDFPLSNTQISNFFLEQEYTDYFNIQQIINGLVESELLREEPTHSNTQYTLTQNGRDTLAFFSDKITPAIQNDLTSYFQKNQMALKEKNSVLADFYKNTQNGYAARCQLKENGLDVLDLTIHVKTKEQAEAICTNWSGKNMDVYSSLMDLLLN